MHRLTEQLDLGADKQIDGALARLKSSTDLDADLTAVLDIAIGITGADMGTLQRLNQRDGHLELVAGRGLSDQAMGFFRTVHRDTNSSCAAAFTRRMRVFVEEISTNYLFVGTAELAILSAEGVAAVQSTPLISSSGRLHGVISTHYRTAQLESAFDHAPFDRLAAQIADSLEDRDSQAPGVQKSSIADRGE